MCPGQTFQYAGGLLVDVVDADPAWGWIPPSGQFREEISSIIVPSRDVMQFNPLEFVHELAHLLAVCCHEGAFVGGLLHDLIND